MNSIVKAKEKDFQLLTDIGKQSLIESHGHSAPIADMNEYISKNYTPDVLKTELSDLKNIYHLIYREGRPAGFSKIIINEPHPNIPLKNVTKLDRIYLLKEFYGLDLGLELLNFNIGLSKNSDQAGMWLFTWKENHRAISFYKKTGFKITGSYDFKLSERHSNPNHQMLLQY